MIVVANTKELEKRYDLNRMNEDEKIRVLGGLAGKKKYNKDRYEYRTTYIVRQLKQIINQMRLIESQIPESWNELQRAKFIYEKLAKNIVYNYNKEEYGKQQCSNLTGIVRGNAICAGYSLIFKEMMDRQGIQCDYIKGLGLDNDSGEPHAWNVLTIQGHNIPVDLTWDSARLRQGEKDLDFFGTNPNFHKTHIPDKDEKRYSYSILKKEVLNSIKTDTSRKQDEITEWQKMDIINLAIEETYSKFKREYGAENSKALIFEALKSYINTNNPRVFTRDGAAREQIKQYVTPDDMLQLIAKSYVQDYAKYREIGVLETSIAKTAVKYGDESAINALVTYIKTGHVKAFTRDGNARSNVTNYINPESAFELIIKNFAEREIDEIEKSEIEKNTIMNKAKECFGADEIALTELPKEKRANLLKKAMSWIKERTQQMFKNKNENSKDLNKEDNTR